MKIFNLKNDLAQTKLKGNIIHFAQQVEELQEQLPIRITQTDNIIVVENLKNLDKINQFEIRPTLVYEALKWLIKNNPLYNKVKCVEHELLDYDINTIIINSLNRYKSSSISNLNSSELEKLDEITQLSNTFNDSMSLNSTQISETEHPNCYKLINNQNPISSILRANFHQNNPIFGDSAGMQCTGICAYAIVFSVSIHVSLWNTEIIDHVMLTGNDYYNEIQQRLRKQLIEFNNHLEINEVIGQISINNQDYSLNYWSNSLDYIFDSTVQGLINLHDLNKQLNLIKNSDCKHFVLTTNQYSFAIIKENDVFYFFNSHSVTPKGRKTKTFNGTACVIKFNQPNSSNNLAAYINNMFQLNSDFIITYLRITLINSNENSQIELPRHCNYKIYIINKLNLA